MSDSADTVQSSVKKEETSPAAATAPSSVDQVQATVTSPEVEATVNLSVKPEVSDHVVVAIETVESVKQDAVQLTAVPTSNPPAPQNHPAVQNQTPVQDQPTAKNESTAPNQQPASSQPSVQNQPTVQNQPSVQNQPTVQSQPAVQNQPPLQNQSTTATQQTVQNQSTVVPNQEPPMQQNQPAGTGFRSQPADDFYRTIFYFSGMGRVIGSALAEGVYVDEKNRRSAIDPDEVKLYTKTTSSSVTDAGSRTPAARPGASRELITSARNQAVNLSADFRRLQSLLESLPTFTDAEQGRSGVTGGGVRVDEPIHGEIYFRSERPEQHQQQQQRMRQQQQMYIIDQNPVISSSHQNMNGHLINVPWNYHNNFQ